MNSTALMALQLSPDTAEALKITAIIFVIAVAISIVSLTVVVPYSLFVLFLKRTSKKKWTRECSSKDEMQHAMYDVAKEWRQEHIACKRDMHIVNEGLNLYGEYFDFGNSKAVIIVPGRTEGLIYGYYFAKPYAESGYNVLSVDQRAHGKSDGKYNSVGFEEYKDVLAWAKLLHEEYGVESVILHGICIGACCSMFALTSEGCPDYVDGMVAEGMYPNFRESFKNHVIAFKQPLYPTLPLIGALIRWHTGANIKFGPIDVIEKLKKPLLMLHSKEDVFSLPSTAQELYDACGSEEKRLVWFEKGAHSRLRITDTERYDSSISDFLKSLETAQVARRA